MPPHDFQTTFRPKEKKFGHTNTPMGIRIAYWMSLSSLKLDICRKTAKRRNRGPIFLIFQSNHFARLETSRVINSGGWRQSRSFENIAVTPVVKKSKRFSFITWSRVQLANYLLLFAVIFLLNLKNHTFLPLKNMVAFLAEIKILRSS